MSNRRMFLMVCCVMVSSAFGADNTYKGLAAIGAAFAVIGAGIGIGNIFSSAAQAIARPVSYTHLTLPTKRIV